MNLLFSPDGTLLASGSWGNIIRLWDVSTGGVRRFIEHACALRSVAFSPDGTLLASGSGDGSVRLWNVSIEVEERHFIDHTGRITLWFFFQVYPARF